MTEEKLLDLIKQRSSKASHDMSMNYDNLDRCYQLIYGRDFYNERNSTRTSLDSQIYEKYDDTATRSAFKYSKELVNTLVPPFIQWGKLVVSKQHIRNNNITDKKLLKQLDDFFIDMTNIVFEHIHASNFSLEMGKSLLEMAISTGVLVVEENQDESSPSSLNFRSIPLSQVSLEQSNSSIIENVFRNFKVKKADLINMWNGRFYKNFPNKKDTDDITLIEGCIKFDKSLEKGKQYLNFIVYEKDNRYNFLYKDLSNLSSWTVFREFTLPNETLGYGRGLQGIPSIAMLNYLVLVSIRQYDITSINMYTYNDSSPINENMITPEPWKILSVEGTLDPVGYNTVNVQITNQAIERYQGLVKDMFVTNVLGNIDTVSARTATEINARRQEASINMLDVSSNLHIELFDKLFRKIIAILIKAGKLTLPENLDIMDIQVISPLTREQSKAQLSKLQQVLDYTMTYAPEDYRYAINTNQLPSDFSKLLDMNIPNIIRSEEEIQEIKQEEIELMQEQMAMQQQQQNQQ